MQDLIDRLPGGPPASVPLHSVCYFTPFRRKKPGCFGGLLLLVRDMNWIRPGEDDPRGSDRYLFFFFFF